MRKLNISGLSYQGTTDTQLESVPAILQEPLGSGVRNHLQLWRKVRDMFKLRKKQNFFPRPAKAVKVKVKALPKCPDVVWPNWNEVKPPPPIVYKSAFESGHTFAAALEKKGFKKLGSGSFSMVYAKEGSDKCIKVCYRLDAWMDYISWAAKKGYCGTFAPRVYSYKYFKGNGVDPFYLAVMERLEGDVGNVKDDHPQAFTYRAFSWGARNALAHANDNYMRCLEVLNPGMPQFVKDFSEFCKTKHPDFHTGNFMVRKDGSFVATDPIMGGADVYPTRLKSKDFTGLTAAPLMRLAA